MSLQPDLGNKGNCYWVKAAIGLKYLGEGLFPFCDKIVRQQHAKILDTVKNKNGATKVCNECSIQNLLPNHESKKGNPCPIGRKECNCCKRAGNARLCPNNVCSDIYDIVFDSYRALPQPPYWRNTNAQKWCEDPWAIAKCFININGYAILAAEDIDSIGLLSLIINNSEFHQNKPTIIIDGHDPLSKVKVHRNNIFHSSSMELDKAVSDSYIDDMIGVLEYLGELKERTEAKNAVEKLQKLKQDDYIITTQDKLDALYDAQKILNDGYQSLYERVQTLEDDKKREQSLKDIQAAVAYQKSILDFKTKLINLYRSSTLRVNPMPFQTDQEYCNFQDIYVKPHIILKSADDTGRDREITSISDVFMNDNKQAKSVFVFGEAGSGKTSFCLSLVYFWCMAHSPEGQINDGFRGMTEMKKYEFLFYVSMRHCHDTRTIHDMIIKQYKDKEDVIKELLHTESDKLLIILDGLDEWTTEPVPTELSDQFQIKHAPVRDYLKDYTLVETSRLRQAMTKTKSERCIEIKGISKESVSYVIEKTINHFDKKLKTSKDASRCENELNDISYEDMKCIPLMLHYLICLWYDNKLVSNFLAAIFAEILKRYFDWYIKKNRKGPQYEELRRKISELAYKMVVNRTPSLPFDDSTRAELKISTEDWQCMMDLGILSKERGRIMCVSESPKELVSFVHKTLQEFLCALYLEGECKTDFDAVVDFCEHWIIPDILDHANIFVFLFGLQPEISKTISCSIYNKCTDDTHIKEYRTERGFSSKHCKLVSDIQNFILKCVTEMKKSRDNFKPQIHLGDVVVNDSFICDEYFCTSLDEEYIIPDRVLSINVDIHKDDENLCSVFKYIAKCCKLENMSIQLSDDYPSEVEDVDNIYSSFNLNALQLKSLFLTCKSKEKYSAIPRSLVRKLPNMDKLMVIEMEDVILADKDCEELCKIISDKTQLERLSLRMFCKCGTQHALDLRRHLHLKYLSLDNAVNVTFPNCSKLTTFKFSDINTTNYMNIFESLKTAGHLLELEFRSIKRIECDKEENVAKSLEGLLQSLTQLEILKLYNLAFSKNVLRMSIKIRHLRAIHLYDDQMSSESMHAFCDGLSLGEIIVYLNSERL